MMTRSPSAKRAPARDNSIPRTREAFSRLEAETERLVAALGESQATTWQDGISCEADAPTFVANGELHLMERRLEKLRSVIASARVVQPNGRVLVGSTVAVRNPEGFLDTYALVAPGEADPRAGRVSLHFKRQADGKTDYRVLEREGRVHVLRQPPPEAAQVGPGRRLRELVESLLPGH